MERLMMGGERAYVSLASLASSTLTGEASRYRAKSAGRLASAEHFSCTAPAPERPNVLAASNCISSLLWEVSLKPVKSLAPFATPASTRCAVHVPLPSFRSDHHDNQAGGTK